VTIENLDWCDFLQRYDRPETFFYLDPPYSGSPQYKHNLGPDDYRKMASVLANVKGNWILSIDNTDAIREIFRGFKQRLVRVKYTIGQVSTGAPVNGPELIITRN
jgi:DNA adenine methylase